MSKIEWTDATWNPVVGCTKVSEGCRNCYAMRMAARQAAIADAKGDASAQQRAYQRVVMRRPGSVNDARTGMPLPQWNNRVVCVEETLEIPLRWKKPRMVFVNSMGDLFHPDVPFEFIDRVFAVMALCPQHTFQVLTKRPERMAEYVRDRSHSRHSIIAEVYRLPDPPRVVAGLAMPPKSGVMEGLEKGWRWPLSNVWLGTSIEDQKTADERIPHLSRCPAMVRFLSCEPLLGEVDLGLSQAVCTCCPRIWRSRWLQLKRPVGPDLPEIFRSLGEDPAERVADVGIYRASSNRHGALCVLTPNGQHLGIKPGEAESLYAPDWVIVGCESNGGRVGRVEGFEDHALSIVRQCREAGTACFVKQIPIGGRVSHDPAEWPEELRVREMPEGVTR